MVKRIQIKDLTLKEKIAINQMWEMGESDIRFSIIYKEGNYSEVTAIHNSGVKLPDDKYLWLNVDMVMRHVKGEL